MALKLVFRADPETARKIREKFPSAVVRRGSCEVKIDGDDPKEVAMKAKELLENVRDVERL